MNFDYAIHSGFIIHWTGKDIDRKYDKSWWKSDKSKTKDCTEHYIKRLRDILKYGLWMTEELIKDKRESVLPFKGNNISIPPIARVCFTEIKLSESRKHAIEYGRLGIGVKRPFIFDRCGRPLIYFHKNRINSDIFLKECANKIEKNNPNLLNFFKSMNSKDKPTTFDWYAESEWRIILFKELLEGGLIIDPRNPNNKEAYSYYLSLTANEQRKLKYLIPIDCWFSMIIYPSLEVKNTAYQSDEIRKLIAEIKKPHISIHCRKDEIENMPIELDIDACRNF